MLRLGMSDKMISSILTVRAFKAGKQAAQYGLSIAECPDIYMPYFPHWLDGHKSVTKINTVGDLISELSCYDAATLLDCIYTLEVNDGGEVHINEITR